MRKIFQEVDADFSNPDKEDLLKVIEKLAEFSKSFRDKKIVEKHFNDIMTLIKKL